MTRTAWLIALLLAAYVGLLLLCNGSRGTDITSSYISCRLVQTHQAAHLYAFDRASYNTVSDPAWEQIAVHDGIAADLLAPFVQTPLWPYALQPLCRTMSFGAFQSFFRILLAVCFCGLIWLTGRHWTTRFFTPLWVGLMAALWLRADTMRAAMLLTQTHAIFLLLTLAAIVLARSRRPLWAGALLAMAAAVKITPGAIVIYWLITKRYKAAIGFLLCSAFLFALTFALAGREITIAYLHSMARVSNGLLTGHNESLAAWWMGQTTYRGQPRSFTMFPMPAALKLLCLGLVALSAFAGGYWDRKLTAQDASVPPYGAVFAMLGATAFTPIAWDHYYIVLVIPLILLLDRYLQRHSWTITLLFIAILALSNTEKLLRHTGPLHLPQHLSYNLFYSGVLSMAAMFVLYRQRLMNSRMDNVSSH